MGMNLPDGLRRTISTTSPPFHWTLTDISISIKHASQEHRTHVATGILRIFEDDGRSVSLNEESMSGTTHSTLVKVGRRSAASSRCKGTKVKTWMKLTRFLKRVDSETMIFAEGLDLRCERSQEIESSLFVCSILTLEHRDKRKVWIGCKREKAWESILQE